MNEGNNNDAAPSSTSVEQPSQHRQPSRASDGASLDSSLVRPSHQPTVSTTTNNNAHKPLDKQVSSATMMTPTRSFGTHSFGSTRGSGMDMISTRTSPSSASMLKRRVSNRCDFLHSPATHLDHHGSSSNGTGSSVTASSSSTSSTTDRRAILTMKSTVSVTGPELETIVSMGEKAYVESKVTQTVGQFRRILTTPRGRVALKSQQYLHEMTNETLDAQRRLLYEVRWVWLGWVGLIQRCIGWLVGSDDGLCGVLLARQHHDSDTHLLQLGKK